MRNIYDSKWYDVGDRRAAEKASQALREKSQEEKKTRALDDDMGHTIQGQDMHVYPPLAANQLTAEGYEDFTFDTRAQERLPLLPEAHSSVSFPDTNMIAHNLSMYSLSPFESNIAATPMALNRISTELRTPHDVQLVERQEPLQEQEQQPVYGQVIGLTDPNGSIVVTEYDILCGRGGATNHHKVNGFVQCIFPYV